MMNTDEFFRNRKTIRRFSDRAVSGELLNEILESAIKAPSCGNMQLYSVIVTREPERKKELAALHFNQPAATGADLILTVCADFNRFTRWCEINKGDAAYNNFLSFSSAMTDGIILAQQITTIAEMKGLGVCWLGTVSYDPEKISNLLKLPELTCPVAALAIGYPAEEGETTERLAVADILYDEEYPVFSDDEIRHIYAVKDNFGPNKKFVEENGKENLAQVFADIRYPRHLNVPFSDILLNYIRKQKFL